MNAQVAMDLDLLWAELSAGAPLAAGRTSFRFDREFYRATYSDIARLDDPAEHFVAAGRSEGRHPTLYSKMRAMHPDLDQRLRAILTEPRLLRALDAGTEGAGELAFELMGLDEVVQSRISDFSSAYYLRTYPDIARAGVNPLVHYIYFGIREGRRTLGGLRRELRKRHWKGRMPFDPGRPTCLIALHEMSRTGAPIVGLDLAREASATMNVVVMSLRPGPLLEDLLEHACDVVASEHPFEEFPYLEGEAFPRIEVAIANSFEAFAFAKLLVARDIPFAAYLHEYPNYTLPLFKALSIGLHSDIAVFSSEHVRDAWKPRLADIEFDLASDSLVVPQRTPVVGGVTAERLAEARDRLSQLIGRDCRDCRIVVGAGAMQWRKGTDIFVMAAQIARARDSDTIFVWIGDGLNREDFVFGIWFGAHFDRVGANDPAGGIFFLPAGPYYRDVLAAADAMFLSSRLDPLPNVVFDALEAGCRVVSFEGATGFADSSYARIGHLSAVEYANPAAAAAALLDLPRKTPSDPMPGPAPEPVFGRIMQALRERIGRQRYFVAGATGDGPTILYTELEADRPFRQREQERLLRFRRRMYWKDAADATETIEESGNWVHAACRIAPFAREDGDAVPDFSLHLHAYHLADLGDAIDRHPMIGMARRRVVTTDQDAKEAQIRETFAARSLSAEILVVPNRGRDILPFLELFGEGGPAGDDPIWCHLHLKKSLGNAKDGDAWRGFLFDILLGDGDGPSCAARLASRIEVGLVTAFDRNFVPWNASRALLPKVAPRLPGPLPDNPLLFPVGNMFWVKREVVLAMRSLFGPGYPWPNEPIASDGTEYHLIERLWPAAAALLGLESIFLDKPDPRRTR